MPRCTKTNHTVTTRELMLTGRHTSALAFQHIQSLRQLRARARNDAKGSPLTWGPADCGELPGGRLFFSSFSVGRVFLACILIQQARLAISSTFIHWPCSACPIVRSCLSPCAANSQGPLFLHFFPSSHFNRDLACLLNPERWPDHLHRPRLLRSFGTQHLRSLFSATRRVLVIYLIKTNRRASL